MERTPDEIKKGLECLTKDNAPDAECEGCPYFEELGYLHWSCHRGKIWADTFILIQQLQDENAQQTRCIENMTDKLNAMNDEAAKLQSERDAALENIRGDCVYCLHLCEDMVAPSCFDCANKGYYRWEWRGVPKEK